VKLTKNQKILGGVIIIALLVLYGKVEKCIEGDTYQGCTGSTALKYVCQGGKWVSEVLEECSESCLEGVCLANECSAGESSISCLSSWKSIRQTCVGGVFQNENIFCQDFHYCQEGAGCVPSPTTCDNGVCDEGETEINCYQDCGVLSSWDEYYSSFSTEEYEQYVECVNEFDCDSNLIAFAVADMESQYAPKTPRAWMASCSDFIYSMMDYSIDGGEAQCHTKASELLADLIVNNGEYWTGNCVDSSTIFIAMARYKGIPVYHAAVCLSSLRNFRCQAFSFVQPKGIPQPLGRIDGQLEGNVLGHAIAMAWNPLENKFSPVDPTIAGVGLAKECFGYSPVLESGIDHQICYIDSWQDLEWCREF